MPLFIIWRMSVVFEGNHSTFKGKTMAKNNRGAAGSQRNKGSLHSQTTSCPASLWDTRRDPVLTAPPHTWQDVSCPTGKNKLHQEICLREATHLQVPPPVAFHLQRIRGKKWNPAPIHLSPIMEMALEGIFKRATFLSGAHRHI